MYTVTLFLIILYRIYIILLVLKPYINLKRFILFASAHLGASCSLTVKPNVIFLFFFLLSNGVHVRGRPDLSCGYRRRGNGVVGGGGSRQRALLWDAVACCSGARRAGDLDSGCWSSPCGTGTLVQAVLFVVMYLLLLSAFIFSSPDFSCFCEI